MNSLNRMRGISHMEMLRQGHEKAQAERDAVARQPTLHEKIQTWFNGLSEDDQRQPWTMKEFKVLFNDTPQKIGAALFDLGWSRKRMWRDDQPTSRYWFKE